MGIILGFLFSFSAIEFAKEDFGRSRCHHLILLIRFVFSHHQVRKDVLVSEDLVGAYFLHSTAYM